MVAGIEVPSAIPRAAGSRGRTASVPPARVATPTTGAPTVGQQRQPPPRPQPQELDTVAARWQLALDAAGHALGAASHDLPAPELARRRSELTT